MPRLIDTDLRTADMVTGVNRVLVAHGIPGLTLRKIAHESGISTGSLLQHFDSRERILRIAAHRTGLALVATEESDSLWVGLDAFLPGDDETLRWTRAWLAWCELGRSETWLADTIGDLRGREREALAHVHELPPGEPGLDLLIAALDGLRVAVCAPIDAMPLDRARDLLRTASAGLLGRSA